LQLLMKLSTSTSASAPELQDLSGMWFRLLFESYQRWPWNYPCRSAEESWGLCGDVWKLGYVRLLVDTCWQFILCIGVPDEISKHRTWGQSACNACGIHVECVAQLFGGRILGSEDGLHLGHVQTAPTKFPSVCCHSFEGSVYSRIL
jgi:hypothetical protein